MKTAPSEPNLLLVMTAVIALLPGLAVLLYYAVDPGLREWLGWHAAWLFLWCGVCVFILGHSLKLRLATLDYPPHRNHGRA